jgi:hypothetical protein
MYEDALIKLADAVVGLTKRFDAMVEADKARKDSERGAANSSSPQDLENARKREEFAAIARADSIPGQIMANKRLRDELDLKERLLSQAMREQGPLTDRERAQMADIQSRHDAVEAHFGRTAPAPLQGETPRGYRIRLLDRLKQYHPELKNADLRNVGGMENVELFEKPIFDAALAEAKHPKLDLPEEGLRKVVRKDESGRDIIEFFGKNTWVKQFASPVVQKVKRLMTEEDLAIARAINSATRH